MKMAAACLCVGDAEFEELVEHVPLATRRKLLLSSTVAIEGQNGSSNSPGLLSFAPCSKGDQMYRHFQHEYSPNNKVTARASEVASTDYTLGSGAAGPASQYDSSCQDLGLAINSNSQGSQADQLTGTAVNADVSGPDKINIDVPPRLSKDERNGSVNSGVISSCQDVGLPTDGNSQGSLADHVTGTEANADTSGLEKINVGAPLPLNPAMSNVSDMTKVDCTDNMLLSFSKDDGNSSVNTVASASCQDVGLLLDVNSQGSQGGQLPSTETNADAFILEDINVGVSLPPNPVQSNASNTIKVECADSMLLSLSKNVMNSSAILASCQDIGLPLNGNNIEGQEDPTTGSEANSDTSGVEKPNVGVQKPPSPLNVSAIRKVDCADNKLLSIDDTDICANNCVIAVNAVDKELTDFTFDELDHIVLKERRILLLKRKAVELEKPALEGTQGTSVGLAEDLMEYSAGRINQELQPIDGECMTTQNQLDNSPLRTASNLSSWSANGSSSLGCFAGRIKEEVEFTDRESWSAGKEINDIPKRSATDPQRTSTSGTEAAQSGNKLEENNIISRDIDDTVSARTYNLCSSTLNTSLKVKVEPLDYSNLQNPERVTSGNKEPVKCEDDISDGIDHMLLRDRMKLLNTVEDFELNSNNFESLRKTQHAAFGFSPKVPEAAIPIRVNRPRKRRKTATDSIETALEEDAPGLLKVLLDKGVLVDEIKLYGESESDDPLDESFNEDSFSELEAVMSKLFSQRSSFFKYAPLRCPKGSKPSYCLACLFSLVEQTRYLQFRRWPVEWGWCRDLQSFIFVFKRHHRIVLERPEYGFATYFFELLDSLPVDWQVKRLVTAMKLTSCGRITLIENKPLSVGEDLTEGEAKVLMEYGWIPDTGLGTMLNYRDRVVHDRKNESDSSEWRSKIGKLLIDGYNGGSIVSTSLAENLNECKDGENVQIKLEY